MQQLKLTDLVSISDLFLEKSISVILAILVYEDVIKM